MSCQAQDKTENVECRAEGESISKQITLISGSECTSATVTIITAPKHGTASLNGGTLTYEPQVNYIGNDYVVYQVDNGVDATAGIVELNVGNGQCHVEVERCDGQELEQRTWVEAKVFENADACKIGDTCYKPADECPTCPTTDGTVETGTPVPDGCGAAECTNRCIYCWTSTYDCNTNAWNAASQDDASCKDAQPHDWAFLDKPTDTTIRYRTCVRSETGCSEDGDCSSWPSAPTVPTSVPSGCPCPQKIRVTIPGWTSSGVLYWDPHVGHSYTIYEIPENRVDITNQDFPHGCDYPWTGYITWCYEYFITEWTDCIEYDENTWECLQYTTYRFQNCYGIGDNNYGVQSISFSQDPTYTYIDYLIGWGWGGSTYANIGNCQYRKLRNGSPIGEYEKVNCNSSYSDSANFPGTITVTESDGSLIGPVNP